MYFFDLQHCELIPDVGVLPFRTGQPLVSKYILPWFGGSPAVWTTCTLFFQTLLFGGYAYAHFVSQRLVPQATLHLVVILTALVFLRVVPDASWKPTDASDPIGRILLLLSVSVGLPYFVLSTTGPLVQAWFAAVVSGADAVSAVCAVEHWIAVCAAHVSVGV